MIHVEKFPELEGAAKAAAGLEGDLARLMAVRSELRQRFDVEAAAIEGALEARQSPALSQIVLQQLAMRLTENDHQISAVLSGILNILVEPQSKQ